MQNSSAAKLLLSDAPLPAVDDKWCLCHRQVAPRHRVQNEPNPEAAFALFALWQEVPTRLPVNTHIVVVGASDCGLSTIESLLLHEKLSFNAVTLVTPGGFKSSHAGGFYSRKSLAHLVSFSDHC